MILLSSDLILAGISSVFVGIFSALVGLGGGFILVPMYTLLFGLAPEIAIGTSITATICTTLSATLFQLESAKAHLSVILRIVLFSLPSAVIGSYCTQYLSGGSLIGIFGIFLLIMAGRLTIWPVLLEFLSHQSSSSASSDSAKIVRTRRMSALFLYATGCLGGLVSGLTGISGGIIFVPALISRKVQIHNAVVISLASIIFTSSGAAATSLLMGHVSIPFLLSTATGVLIGGAIGVRLSPYLTADLIRWMLGVSIGTIALVMIIKALTLA
ncbi:sulfite exporter TauE/SafE family protein [uncultured Methanospirillum sp.]|uniref:sulfite exporter TauE/SafE family protein n=1 Tax=uncultured Methanospirillum sp. TaxID=262503 RepID=UPI0029C864ED|nr:sulfite exporter TauE/SafE family protein [uncultured Methanospirillum sp.]